MMIDDNDTLFNDLYENEEGDALFEEIYEKDEKDLKVGEETDAFCTKCKQVLNHVVVSKLEDKIKKVQCRTCQGTHLFRKDKPNRGRKKVPTKKSSETIVNGEFVDDEWNTLNCAKDSHLNILQYSLQKDFSEKDVIDHPQFGIGFVRELIIPNKMNVLFKHGIKLMIRNFEK